MTSVTSSGRTPRRASSVNKRGGPSTPKLRFCLSLSFGPAPVSTSTTFFPSRMRREFMSMATRFSSSAGFCFSQSTFGTTPNIAPPSSRKMPSLKISTWKRPMFTRVSMDKVEIREFRDGDGGPLRAFWESCGINIRPGDDDGALALFAARNPDLFLIAADDRGIAASALAGWDGRRGWLYHVAVRPDLRRTGIGLRLVRTVEQRLRALGCPKVNLIVWQDNEGAMAFWSAAGYARAPTVEYEKQL